MIECKYCGGWGSYHYSSCSRPSVVPNGELKFVPYEPQEDEV